MPQPLNIQQRKLLVIALLLALGVLVMLPRHAPEQTASLNKESDRLTSEAPVNNDYPFLTLDYIRKVMQDLLHQAETMTPEEYAVLSSHSPNLPATLEGHREVLKARIAELNAMTPADWQREINETLPPIRHMPFEDLPPPEDEPSPGEPKPGQAL